MQQARKRGVSKHAAAWDARETWEMRQLHLTATSTHTPARDGMGAGSRTAMVCKVLQALARCMPTGCTRGAAGSDFWRSQSARWFLPPSKWREAASAHRRRRHALKPRSRTETLPLPEVDDCVSDLLRLARDHTTSAHFIAADTCIPSRFGPLRLLTVDAKFRLRWQRLQHSTGFENQHQHCPLICSRCSDN